ncbi:MAG: nicotinate (nicotinamide) nucleotide adenylyltransferase [Clostridium sp.]|nr:nicotinate (nicotinamide) nucleotide adenylyltransferase [Clostridium sp.]
MKIGILGGTFNPVHNGHMYMAYESIDRLNLDKVYFLPNYIPPHKLSKDRNFKDSIDMIKLVINDNDKFYLSCYEIEKKEISYTYETVQHFREIYPDDELYFLIGEDSYVEFSTWKRPETILDCVTLVIFERKFYNDDKRKKAHEFIKSFGKKEIILDSLTLEISSKDIRKRVKNEKNISFLVPEPVNRYIIDNELYKG